GAHPLPRRRLRLPGLDGIGHAGHRRRPALKCDQTKHGQEKERKIGWVLPSSLRMLTYSDGMRFLLAAILATPLAAAVSLPPSDEPTADEVAILELMNRFRADPKAETKRILEDPSVPGFMWRGVDK